MNKRACFLGVDIGATKTHALLIDERGAVLGFGAECGANPDSLGYDGMAAILERTLQAALAEAGQRVDAIRGAGFGVGGYDWPSQLEPNLAALCCLGLECPLEVVNDAVLGIYAGADAGWGVGLTAGTSCNCWGVDREGRMGRLTGFSWMGENAGGLELTVKAVQAVAKEWTRRGPATRLTAALAQQAGQPDAAALLEALSLRRVSLDPAWAKVVFRLAAEGDAVAQELVAWAGEELSDLALGVIRQLGFETLAFDLVLAGSFFKGSPRLEAIIRARVHTLAPGARITRLHAPPVVGAALLGMKTAGWDPNPARAKLLAAWA